MGRSGKTDGFFYRNRSVFALGLSALIIAAVADLFAGLFLTAGLEEFLKAIPGMMILIYCAIGMRGNIFGAMGSRLGTSMHIGTFKMTFRKRSILRSNIEASMALTLLLSLMMGATGWIITLLFFPEHCDPAAFIFISLLGGLLSGAVVVVFNIVIAYIGYKRDWDVDNITAPLIAAVGDIVTVPMIFVSAIIQRSIGDVPTMIACAILSAVTAVFVTAILMRKNRRRKRIDEAKRIVKQSLPVLTVCMFFEIGAGVIIESVTGRLMGCTALLILLPAFLNEGNALSGMLTSRLSSMLHLGTLEPKAVPKKGALENFAMIYIMAAATFFLIGAAAYGAAVVTTGGSTPDFWGVIVIVIVAGLLTTTVLNFISYYVAIVATKFNLDPDDHSIPITSSVMDVIGTGILVLVIAVMLL